MRIKTKAKVLESVDCKCYRPGDPEFEAIVSQVTPLHKIRSDFSYQRTLYPLDERSEYSWKRNESVNDLFAGVKYLTA